MILRPEQVREAMDWLRANNGDYLYLERGEFFVDDGARMYIAPLGTLVENVRELKRLKGRD